MEVEATTTTQWVMFTIDRYILAHLKPRLYFFLPADELVELEQERHFLGITWTEEYSVLAKDVPLGVTLATSKARIVAKKIINSLSEAGLSRPEWPGLVDEKFLESGAVCQQ